MFYLVINLAIFKIEREIYQEPIPERKSCFEWFKFY